jgi:hypothetical protein
MIDLSRSVVLNQSDFAPRGYLIMNVWTTCGCHSGGGATKSWWWQSGMQLSEHPTMPRVAPQGGWLDLDV